MSLINDVLKDLDGKAPVRVEDFPSGLSSAPASRPTGRRWLLPALAGVAVIYALVVEFNVLGLFPEKTSVAVEIPQPIAFNRNWMQQGPAATEVVAQTVTPAEASLAPVESHSSEAEIPSPYAVIEDAAPATSVESENTALVASDVDATAPAESALSQTEYLAPLLQAAEAALRDKRFTTPAGDNAYQYFRSILLLVPDHPQAVAGISEIQQIYLNWLEQALADQRLDAARDYWLKARNVGVEESVLRTYEDRIKVSSPIATRESAPESSPVKSSIRRAGAGVADDLSAAVRLQRDGLVVGEARALRWLEEGTPVEQTAVVLADFYAARGDVGKLIQLQQLLLRRDSAAATFVSAHLAARQQNFQAAVEQLTSASFTGQAEERRQRMLAGFYLQLQRYTEALPIYSDLVNLASGNVNDWLGLAVCADAQQLSSVAQNAFFQVLRLTHPDSRVMAFARQRHQDLSFSSSR